MKFSELFTSFVHKLLRFIFEIIEKEKNKDRKVIEKHVILVYLTYRIYKLLFQYYKTDTPILYVLVNGPHL